MVGKLYKKFKLRDIINLRYGKGLPKNKRKAGKYPVYGSGGIVGTHNEALVKGPGIIIGRKGSIGSVFYEKESFYPIDTVYFVEQKDQHLDLYYLSQLLSKIGLENLNSDAAVPGLNRDYALSQEVLIPPLFAQRKIASILSAYDDLIENNLRRIKILEEMAQLIYREWFVHFRFPGHEKVKLVDSPLGKVPEGWEISNLDKFGDIITGKTPSKKKPEYFGGDMPFIKIPDMYHNLFCIKTLDNLSNLGAESQKKKTIPPNSLCVSCIGTVGLVTITALPSQTNQQINSIILYNENYLEYLYFSLLNLKETIEGYASTGATMNNLSRGKFVSLKVLYPSIKVINKFNNLAFPIFQVIRCLQQKNDYLRQTRDLILPKLISGELDVSDLDIDTGGLDQ